VEVSVFLRAKKEHESASAKSCAWERESASAKSKKSLCPALVHIHKYISHYCFAKCILSTPLDYCELICIRNNRDYRLCKI
jgi:hypothetical protein